MSRNNRTPTNHDVFAGLGVKAGPVEEGSPLEEARLLPINKVKPNPEQPRKQTNPKKDDELAADIGERGVLQPILVRPYPKQAGIFQIIAGERRWRAATQAGLEEIPAIVREDLDDREVQIIALVENLQRLDLELEDEINFFQRLASEHNYSNRDISRLINRSPQYVNDRMKMVQGGAVQPAPQTTSEAAKPAQPIVRERPKPQPKHWSYRPQPFQRLHSYISETLDNWEQVSDEKSREALLHDVTALKEELAQLEQKLHPKGRR